MAKKIIIRPQNDTRANALTPTSIQAHGKMSSIVTPHLAQLQYGSERVVLWGTTNQSARADRSQTDPPLWGLQAATKTQVKKQRKRVY